MHLREHQVCLPHAWPRRGRPACHCSAVAAPLHILITASSKAGAVWLSSPPTFLPCQTLLAPSLHVCGWHTLGAPGLWPDLVMGCLCGRDLPSRGAVTVVDGSGWA